MISAREIPITHATTHSNANTKDLKNVYDNDNSTSAELIDQWIKVYFQTRSEVTRVRKRILN